MREIDPIRNPSEALLSAALHRLASGSPQNAPAELGADLAQAFRHHHRRRRQVRMVAMTSLAACLALVMVLLAAHKPAIRQTSPVAQQEVPVTVPAPSQTPSQDHPQQTGQTRPQTVTSSADENAFVPLDTYDPAMAPSELAVVRLELSGADLRLMGAPVAEDLSERRLLADIVVGNDGTPYAVRIVQ